MTVTTSEIAERLNLVLGSCSHFRAAVSRKSTNQVFLAATNTGCASSMDVSASFFVENGNFVLADIRNYSEYGGYGEAMVEILIAAFGRKWTTTRLNASGVVFWTKMRDKHSLELTDTSGHPIIYNSHIGSEADELASTSQISHQGGKFNHDCRLSLATG